MTWRGRIWTGISAAFMALAALVPVVSTGPAQELDYTLEELERKIDESPRVKLLLASPGLDPGGGRSRCGLSPFVGRVQGWAPFISGKK